MSKPMVSICISVHNTAKYLPRCLDSIINQTFTDYEIILVNNGSTDNSEKIMQSYADKYQEKAIRIFRQKDLGLAQGRQRGVIESSGQYIMFLDADDFFSKNKTIGTLFSKIKEYNADIVEMWTDRDGQTIKSKYSESNGLIDAKDYLISFLRDGDVPTMLWLRMYKRELFFPSVFPVAYINNEDNFSLPCILYNAHSICFVDQELHVYSSDNEQSFMNEISSEKNQEKYTKTKISNLFIYGNYFFRMVYNKHFFFRAVLLS